MTADRDRTGTDRAEAALMPVGQVLNIADLVSYAEHSIVSRTLVERDAVTITLFAFDAGQGLSEHTTPFDALVQVLHGKGTFTVGGEERAVGARQALLMPADVPHSVKAEVPFKMLLTMLRSGGE